MEVQEEVEEGDEAGEADGNRSRHISASNPKMSTRLSSGKESIGTGVAKPPVANVRRRPSTPLISVVVSIENSQMQPSLSPTSKLNQNKETQVEEGIGKHRHS